MSWRVEPGERPEQAEARIARRLSLALGRPVDFRWRAGSTNDLARELALRGAPDGSWAVADAQDAGRGRRGRSWSSPPGVDLYASRVCRLDLPPGRLPLAGFAAALALLDALPAGLGLELKWPNDLLAGGRKLAGVLAEAVPGAGPGVLVLGIGLDVNRPAFPPELPRATSLYLLDGRRRDRGELFLGLARALDRRLAELVLDPPGLLRGYRERCGSLGRRQRLYRGDPARPPRPGELLEGRAVGIADDGALLLEAGGGIHRVSAGELLLPGED